MYISPFYRGRNRLHHSWIERGRNLALREPRHKTQNHSLMQDTISFHPLVMEPLYLLVFKPLEFMRNTILAHFWEVLWPLCLHIGPSVNTKIPSKTFNKSMKEGKNLENEYHAYRDSATNCLRHYNRKIYAIIIKNFIF